MTYIRSEISRKDVSYKLEHNKVIGTSSDKPSGQVSEADATKVWQVTPVQKGTKTEEIVIVPEQTLVDNQELEYNNKFVPGAQCVAVVNGVEYRGEVIEDELVYIFRDASFGSFEYSEGMFKFWNDTGLPEVTAKLSIIEETPIYDYNWAPGVKIPIPTAEDEGKILVVTKVAGDNTSIIVPEQQVPADDKTSLTDVDLTKFVVSNTVKVTIVSNSQTFTATGVIILDVEEGIVGVEFHIQELDDNLIIVKIENSLMTDAYQLSLTNATIKLEYIESNYEYQLQENSGGSSESSTSNVLWPAMYEYDGHEIMATFVPEDVEPNTWCMVCGAINGDSIDTCLPVLITSYENYVILNVTDNSVEININLVHGGSLLSLRAKGPK